jgi:hypothetical protein
LAVIFIHLISTLFSRSNHSLENKSFEKKIKFWVTFSLKSPKTKRREEETGSQKIALPCNAKLGAVRTCVLL